LNSGSKETTEGEQVALLEALRAGDRAALSQLLAENVVFDSPVRTYHGREDVLRLLMAIARVLDDVRATRQLHAAGETCSFVTARLEEKEAEGVLDEVRDEQGGIIQLTSMLRPLEVLLVAIERMGQELAAGDD
jgi:hypothetical protein